MSNFQFQIESRGVVREEGFPTARRRVSRRRALAGGKRVTGPRVIGKILNVTQAIKIARELKRIKKTIILCGGCFDILHIGHIRFLKNAKRKGDFLFVLLESDENVRRLKGKERPINSQKDRAEILSSLEFVDYTVLLPNMNSNFDYDKLIFQLNPNVLAVTEGGSQMAHVLRQARKIKAKVVEVTKQIKDKSTTNLARLIEQDF